MSKFKVGDKVNYIGKEYTCVTNPCTISKFYSSQISCYVIDASNDGWWLYPTTIEHIIEPIANNNKLNSDMFKECICKELEVSEQGGKGSFTGTRMDLVPAKAIVEVGKVMFEGAQKYDEDNWRKVEIKSHINHALKHTYEYLDTNSIEELSHATTRLLMALELILTNKKDLPF